MEDKERYDRQTRLFGGEGQEAIAATRVAIVGLGGLGSHLVQQLAYLGVRDFVLIDDDYVTGSNLNRLIGTGPEDAREGRHKVKVSVDLVEEIAPRANVQTLDDVFISKEGFGLLRTVDVVFGAVDNEMSRLVLNDFCQAHDISYLDAATDVDLRGPGAGYGGRVMVSNGGGGCLSCFGLLDQEALDVEQATEDELRDREEIYGVDAEALDARGPSVVSVNGVVASLAVTEFMNLVTGLRDPRLHLTYQGSMGIVSLSGDRKVETCYYCDERRGRKEAFDEERYVREGLERG